MRAVAYVRYDAVLGHGRTKLKVLLAEAPNSRWPAPGTALYPAQAQGASSVPLPRLARKGDSCDTLLYSMNH